MSESLRGYPDRMLSIREVGELTGFSTQTINRKIGRAETEGKKHLIDPTFPKPLRLGPNRIAWRLTRIMEWIDAKEAEADAT